MKHERAIGYLTQYVARVLRANARGAGDAMVAADGGSIPPASTIANAAIKGADEGGVP